jgi:hypothetical protein
MLRRRSFASPRLAATAAPSDVRAGSGGMPDIPPEAAVIVPTEAAGDKIGFRIDQRRSGSARLCWGIGVIID